MGDEQRVLDALLERLVKEDTIFDAKLTWILDHVDDYPDHVNLLGARRVRDMPGHIDSNTAILAIVLKLKSCDSVAKNFKLAGFRIVKAKTDRPHPIPQGLHEPRKWKIRCRSPAIARNQAISLAAVQLGVELFPTPPSPVRAQPLFHPGVAKMLPEAQLMSPPPTYLFDLDSDGPEEFQFK
jgi:hypothetical protein